VPRYTEPSFEVGESSTAVCLFEPPVGDEVPLSEFLLTVVEESSEALDSPLKCAPLMMVLPRAFRRV
jgi:hypothetical protein